MIQQKRKITTKRNNITHSADIKHLSIQFSLDGFSFCILNKSQKEYTALYTYDFKDSVKTPHKLLSKITDIFNQNDSLKEKYNTVTVCHQNDLSTFVPKALFNKDKLSTYIQYNNKVLDNDFYAYDEIENHDIINVFIPYVNVNNFFIDQFGGFEYKHYSSVLVQSLFGVFKYSLEPQVFAHITQTHFELVVIKNRKLQLYNTFKYKSKEDFIYYVLFTAEQLKLNPEKFKLHLLGNVRKDDELYTMALKYVRHVQLLENRSNYTFSEAITEEEKRTYFTLLNLV